ncbi:hypothetical protein H0H92_004390 [Tricholoma furcatifolium]|nr:hypothetical protein H0H92_004390 [Tricholoma furcatifolium]
MLRLQLDTGEIITVALQVKLRASTAKQISKVDILKAIRSVTPEYLWINKNGKPFAPKEFPGLHSNRTCEALDWLPCRFKPHEPGYHSLIRGIFAFAAYPNDDFVEKVLRVAKEKRKDLDPKHDLFVIPSRYLKQLTRELNPAHGLERWEMGMVQQSEESGEYKRLRESLKKAEKPWKTASTFLPLEQVNKRIVRDLVELEKMEMGELGWQLDLHRRREVLRFKKRGGHPCDIQYITPSKYSVGMSTKDGRMEAVERALLRLMLQETDELTT